MTPHYQRLASKLSVQARAAAPRNRVLFDSRDVGGLSCQQG